MITVGSLYSGIGGIDKGMKQAGFKILWANEIDKNACKTYRANHLEKLIEGDIHQIDIQNLSYVDVLAGGFPCQPFSVAGYRKGFDDDRGNNFSRIMQIVDIIKPSVIFLENVKNIKTHDKCRTYNIISNEIKSRGYWFKDAILNTSEYGNIPHNRERFFLVAFKDKGKADKFKLPDKLPLTTTIQDFIEKNRVDNRYYYANSIIHDQLAESIVRTDTLYQWRRKYVRENKNDMCPTLTANMGTGGHNVPLILTDYGIRKLTPLECFRFQGFPDIKFPDIAISHLYKQAGNSVSIPVIYRIAKNIMDVMI